MFTHGKRPLSLWLGRFLAAGMLLALLVFMCSLRSPAVEVSAAEREEETVLDSREEIFVTTSATLTSRSSAAEVTFPAGTEVVIRSADVLRTVETREETVAQLLDRLRMEVSPIEMVSVDLTADPIEIVIDSSRDDEPYFTDALTVIDEIISGNSVDIDTVSGATYSSGGIIDAVTKALAQAQITGGEAGE